MINKEDILKEISEKELFELCYFDGADEKVILQDAINDALAYIESFIRIPKQPTALLRSICVELTLLELKKKQRFPAEFISSKRKELDALLLKMSADKLPASALDTRQNRPQAKIRAFRHRRDDAF